MDLKGYYRKLRKKGEEMPDGDQVVVSEATPDGGVAGVLSEVTKMPAGCSWKDGRGWRARKRRSCSGWSNRRRTRPGRGRRRRSGFTFS